MLVLKYLTLGVLKYLTRPGKEVHDILHRLISRQHSREDLPENLVTYSGVLAEHLAALKLLVAAS